MLLERCNRVREVYVEFVRTEIDELPGDGMIAATEMGPWARPAGSSRTNAMSVRLRISNAWPGSKGES